MARLHVMERSKAQDVMGSLHEALERRLAVSSLAPCPVEFAAAYVGMCASQSCGKCTPCRVGLRALGDLFDEVLENRADERTLDLIESTARTVYLSADCAIGYEAGEMALTAIQGFRDDFEHHVAHHACGFDHNAAVPCVHGCPANVDIPGYIGLVEAGRYTDAVKLIRKDNPLPLVCGLICEHPCELYCRRGMVDDPMNIRGLKRYAIDHMDDYDMGDTCAEATGKKVAIIGGGPAGLTAAYYLTLMGHDCTIFEVRHHLGGMLRYGIPNYRLPHDELQREIDWILRLGVEVRLDTYVTDLATLKEQGFDATFIAIGAHNDNKLGLPGEDAEGVISAVELLRDMGDERPRDFSGKTVAVIGGGNVAMDVARTSVRLGASKVVIVYRRREADMTCQAEEIAGAKEEGCELLELHAPKEIVTKDGKVCGLKVERQIIGGLSRGRFAPRKADAEEITIDCDVVAVAIGQKIDSAPFEEQGVTCKWGRIQAASDLAVPGFDGVFCGGDCQHGPATVIRAINDGKVAAANIDAYLGFHHVLEFPVELAPVRFKGKVSCARCEMTEREAARRIYDFDIVEHGLTDEEAHQEASRCLHCDHFGYGAFRGGRVFEW